MTARVLALLLLKTTAMFLCIIRLSKGSGFKSLSEGDNVTFQMEQGPKGPKATNVVKL
jgi:hypothetical protein